MKIFIILFFIGIMCYSQNLTQNQVDNTLIKQKIIDLDDKDKELKADYTKQDKSIKNDLAKIKSDSEVSSKILDKVHIFYNDSWNKLIGFLGILIVIIPLILGIFIKTKLKQENKELNDKY